MNPSTPPHPAGGGDSYHDCKLSLSSLAPEVNTKNLMGADLILQSDWYIALPHSEKREVYKCILFIYGFMLADAVRPDCAELWRNRTTQARIAVVRSMISKENRCRERLLGIADASDDNDLLAAGANVQMFENYLRCLLRFFSKRTSFGFTGRKMSMTDLIFSFCDQSFGGCFLISSCNLVDLQIQHDLDLGGSEKYKCLDKTQVARRGMSSTELTDYVVLDRGNSSLDVVRKLLGAEEVDDVLRKYMHTDSDFQTEKGVELLLNVMMRTENAVLLAFSSANLASPSDNDLNRIRIPFFDSFNDPPSGFLALNDAAENEDEKIQNHLGTGGDRSSVLRRSLSARGELFGDTPATPLSSSVSSGTTAIPLTASSSSVSSGTTAIPLAAPDDQREPESSWSWSGFTSFIQSFLGGGSGVGESEDIDPIDRVATPSTGTNQPPDEQRHSVVLIGGYTDENGKVWYLMLNSWKKMPLFLASAKCLVEAKANAAHLRRRIERVPHFKRHNRRCTECASPPAVINDTWVSGNSSSTSRRKDDGFVCTDI